MHNLLTLIEPPRGAFELACLYADRDLFLPESIGNKHPVVVIPGYHCDDGYTKMFRSFLRRLDFTQYGWGQNTNLAKMYQYNRVKTLITKLYDKHETKVRLVGYSLGGLYARKLAIDCPEIIHSVVTVGSPIRQEVETASMKTLTRYAKFIGADQQIGDFLDCIQVEPKVLTTVIYSRTDGIVHWRNALDKVVTPHIKHISVTGSHMGMMHNPLVWRTIKQLYHFH